MWITHFVSFIVGRLVRITIPSPLARLSVKIFAALVGAKVEEAEKPLNEYPCIQAFFTRTLRPGLRPLDEGIVSPVDGMLRSSGLLSTESPVIEQIKGINYSVVDLLGSAEDADLFRGGRYFNLYLSPGDYHRIHAPSSGDVILSRHIPGALWPVNDWSLRSIEGVFVKNERVVSLIQTERGCIAVVLVAATNVGGIELAYHPDFVEVSKGAVVRYADKKRLEKGQHLGTFHMGSSVVLLCQRGVWDQEFSAVLVTPCAVKFGQRLG